MTSVEITESVTLESLLATVKKGEEVLITDHSLPVAKLIPAESARKPLRLGLWESLPGPFWMAPDFDEPLEDFREYMPE